MHKKDKEISFTAVIITAIIMALAIMFAMSITTRDQKTKAYNRAMAWMDLGDYHKAYTILVNEVGYDWGQSDDYDSTLQIEKAKVLMCEHHICPYCGERFEE